MFLGGNTSVVYVIKWDITVCHAQRNPVEQLSQFTNNFPEIKL